MMPFKRVQRSRHCRSNDNDDKATKPPQLLAQRMLRDAEDYAEGARQLVASQKGAIILK
jgi:hypothetical protein